MTHMIYYFVRLDSNSLQFLPHSTKHSALGGKVAVSTLRSESGVRRSLPGPTAFMHSPVVGPLNTGGILRRCGEGVGRVLPLGYMHSH